MEQQFERPTSKDYPLQYQGPLEFCPSFNNLNIVLDGKRHYLKDFNNIFINANRRTKTEYWKIIRNYFDSNVNALRLYTQSVVEAAVLFRAKHSLSPSILMIAEDVGYHFYEAAKRGLVEFNVSQYVSFIVVRPPDVRAVAIDANIYYTDLRSRIQRHQLFRIEM